MKKKVLVFILFVCSILLSCSKEGKIVYASLSIDYTPTSGKDSIAVLMPHPGDFITEAPFIYLVLEDYTVAVTGILNGAIDEKGFLSIPEVTSGGIVVVNGESSKVVGGIPVTCVGMLAFMGQSNLISINMPSIKIIGREAFAGCMALKNVNMPMAKIIGEGTFQHCSGLIDVTMPMECCFQDENSTFPSFKDAGWQPEANGRFSSCPTHSL